MARLRPEIVAKLAAERRQKVETLMVAPGGWRLKVMRFRAVSPRAGVLAGTIDATRAGADAPVRLQARLELRKQ